MTTVEDLVRGIPPEASRPVEMDPLREEDALLESQLLDCRVSPLTSTAALLIEMRTALQFDEGNTALLIVRGQHSFRWSTHERNRALVAMTILSSAPSHSEGRLGMELAFHPSGNLAVSGDRMEFFILDVPGIGSAPPGYPGSTPADIEHGLPRWSSPCTVLQTSSSASRHG